MLTSRLLMRLLTLVCTLLQVFQHLTEAGGTQLLGNRRIRSKQVRAAAGVSRGSSRRQQGQQQASAGGALSKVSEQSTGVRAVVPL